MDFEEFYAERVAQFERERRIFREYAALVPPDRKESHNLEWENKKLDNTASEIKIEVDRHAKEAKLLETQIHATMEELNSLKSAKEARNLQIQRLCKLSNPVQRDVTYLVEERFNLRSTRDSEARSGDIILGTVPAGYKPMKTGEVIKLESRLQSETLKTTGYLEDVRIAIREAEEERHRYRKMKVSSTVDDLAEAKTLYQAVDELEAQSFLAISELLRLRVSILIAQREEMEQLELLQRDKAYFIEKEETTRNQVCLSLRFVFPCLVVLGVYATPIVCIFAQLIADMSLMQKRVKAELQECTRDFQKQLSALNVKLKELQLKEEWIKAEHVKEDSDDVGLIEQVEAAKKRCACCCFVVSLVHSSSLPDSL
jgi:hypothetical protein